MHTDNQEPDMLDEYDFSKMSDAVRGKYHQAYQQGHTVRITREDGTVEVHHYHWSKIEMMPNLLRYLTIKLSIGILSLCAAALGFYLIIPDAVQSSFWVSGIMTLLLMFSLLQSQTKVTIDGKSVSIRPLFNSKSIPVDEIDLQASRKWNESIGFNKTYQLITPNDKLSLDIAFTKEQINELMDEIERRQTN